MSGRLRAKAWQLVVDTPAVWGKAVGDVPPVVALFRRKIVVERALSGVVLHITASQRFVLYVDGVLLERGPVRSDPSRWNVHAVKLPRLGKGEHVVAVCVFHLGSFAGVGQMGERPFLLCCGVNEKGERVEELSTGFGGWKVKREESREWIAKPYWKPRPPYFVAGAGERFDASRAVRGWKATGFEDGGWEEAEVFSGENVNNPWGNRPIGHELQENPLPAIREFAVEFARGNEAKRVEAEKAAEFVLDRGEVTNAYPTFRFRGGAGSVVECVWSEAPYNGDGTKRRRDDWEGAEFFGTQDVVKLSGGERVWEPLWFRSFRYLHVRVKAGAEAVEILPVELRGTEFPLDLKMRPKMKTEAETRCWEVSFRTAKLCAHETMFDCPHYEQMQFSGDSRIQALYHYLVCDEDRLGRKAIDDMHASRLPMGILQSRFPSAKVQVIPTFSLYWIAMLGDFLKYRGDAEFVGRYLPTARGIVDWFLRHRREDGLLGRIPFAPFVDWTPAFAAGNAPQDEDGGSSILACLVAGACVRMSGMERKAGYRELAGRWEREAEGLRKAVKRNCWDSRRGLMADTAAKKSFSVHGQVEAVLAGVVDRKVGLGMLRAVDEVEGFAQPGSFYYRFYLYHAYRACGKAIRLEELLGRFVACLDASGLTTWPETERANPRSDCHGWGVLPAIAIAYGQKKSRL